MDNIQVIMHEGLPEYAVLPWAEYQALLAAAGKATAATAHAHSSRPSAAPVVSPVVAVEQATNEQLSLAQLRHKTGLTPELLAQALGISPSYWMMIESGERKASDVILRALRRLANVTIE